MSNPETQKIPADLLQPLSERAGRAGLSELSLGNGLVAFLPDGYSLGQEWNETIDPKALVLAMGHEHVANGQVVNERKLATDEGAGTTIEAVLVASKDPASNQQIITVRALNDDDLAYALAVGEVVRIRDVTSQVYPEVERVRVPGAKGAIRTAAIIPESEYHSDQISHNLAVKRTAELRIAGSFFEEALSGMNAFERSRYTLLGFLSACARGQITRDNPASIHTWIATLTSPRDKKMREAMAEQSKSVLELLETYNLDAEQVLGWVQAHLLNVPGYDAKGFGTTLDDLVTSPAVAAKLKTSLGRNKDQARAAHNWLREHMARALPRVLNHEIGTPYHEEVQATFEAQALSLLIKMVEDPRIDKRMMEEILISPYPLHQYAQYLQQYEGERLTTKSLEKKQAREARVARYLRAMYGDATAMIDGTKQPVGGVASDESLVRRNNRFAILDPIGEYTQEAVMELALASSVLSSGSEFEVDAFDLVRKARSTADEFREQQQKVLAMVKILEESSYPEAVRHAVLKAHAESINVVAGIEKLSREGMDRSLEQLRRDVSDFCDAEAAVFQKSMRNAVEYLVSWEQLGDWLSLRRYEDLRNIIWEKLLGGVTVVGSAGGETIYPSDSKSVGWWLQYVSQGLDTLKLKVDKIRYLIEVREVATGERRMRLQPVIEDVRDRTGELNRELEALLPDEEWFKKIAAIQRVLGSDQTEARLKKIMTQMIIQMAPTVLGRQGATKDVEKILGQILAAQREQADWTRTGR